MSFNSRDFRDALGHFVTGVVIITTRTPSGEPLGLTVNSFASVSLDPPLVLWSLDRTSDRFQTMMSCTHFGVSVLGSDNQHLSHRLSRKGETALEGETLRDGPHNVPLLDCATAHFVCSVESRVEGGDHVIFLGRVLDFGHKGHGHPLVFYRGRYRVLGDLEG